MESKSPLGRLSGMMFLQYAVWGAWLPIAGRFFGAAPETGGLGFSSADIGLILGVAASIGAIAAPFVAGQIADRYFRTERFLGFLLLVGAALQWKLRSSTTVNEWLVLGSLYSVLYMPTLALSNSLAFAHLNDRTREFGKVRVWGTIGWIAASWIFPMIWLQHDLELQAMPPFLVGPEMDRVTGRLSDAFLFSAIVSAIYGVYALTCLPATPPKKDATQKLAFARAFALLAKPSMAVLMLAGLAISMIHQIYFIQAGPFLSAIGLKDSEVGPAMTAGQFSEILMIAMLGFALKRLGFKLTLTLGALAYFGRYFVWSTEGVTPTIAVTSQALHGICYAFFFASAYIYVDRLAPPDVRHSAQTMFGIVMLGGGPILGGAFVNRWLSEANTVKLLQDGVELTKLEFGPFFRTLSWIGLGAAALILWAFKDETKDETKEQAS
ncbi:MAG: MFS transporter [Planctomycetes bacterium]|nr:MFS transporter [Planctomycetota bacterium]